MTYTTEQPQHTGTTHRCLTSICKEYTVKSMSQWLIKHDCETHPPTHTYTNGPVCDWRATPSDNVSLATSITQDMAYKGLELASEADHSRRQHRRRQKPLGERGRERERSHTGERSRRRRNPIQPWPWTQADPTRNPGKELTLVCT